MSLYKLLLRYRANPTRDNAKRILAHTDKYPCAILLLSISESAEVGAAMDWALENDYRYRKLGEGA